ncbi:peroxisomal membrane protein PEX13 [Drosophila tropicalis]|uniref:peroxisomal membrane protein PEX13 n=1 Tax=Drosophila tropicalis TaxID=46794 RepID=UPI0035ABE29C
MADNNNLRTAVINDAPLLPPSSSAPGGGFSSGPPPDAVLRTPYAGNVRALPPPLPQSPYQQTQSLYGGYGGGYNSGGFGLGGGGYGGYQTGGFGYGLGMGMGGYGGGYGGGYNRFGMGMGVNDPEQRFIQMAEASSRPAFQSIESLVSAIGNIASMLDSTFFALTSSFRAILGVAANFGRLRTVFAQFWTTFAIFRGLNWIYRKILYWLRISNLDPSSVAFKKAFAEALNDNQGQKGGAGVGPKLPRKGTSPWPVLAFISFIFTAPYLIMRLLGTVTNTAQEEARDPARWTSPIQTQAMFDFQARNQNELSLRVGQSIQVAPREIQQTLNLLNTGWALATINGQTSGIIPINYVKSPQQIRQEQQALKVPSPPSDQPQPSLMNLSADAFPGPPLEQQLNYDFNLAAQQQQPLGPPSTMATVLEEGFP